MDKRTSIPSAVTLLRRPSLFAPALTLLAALTAFPANATSYTYTGGDGGSFSTGFSPLLPAEGTTTSDSLNFGGSNNYTATDDISALSLNSLSFTNTGAVTLTLNAMSTDNSISLGGRTPSINLNNSGALTVNLNLSLALTTTFNGSGSATITGIMSGNGGINANGTGILTLTGANTYAGVTSVSGGTLRLDFSAAGAPTSDIINNSSALTLAGGTLNLVGGSDMNPDYQHRFNGLTINPGASNITLSGDSQNIDLDLGSITRYSPNAGTIDFSLNAGRISATTSNSVGGLLGGYATVDGSDWAAIDSSGLISAYNSYTNFDPNNAIINTGNYSLTGGSALTDSATLNTLKISNTADCQSLNLGSNSLTFATGLNGGLLFVGGTGTDNSYTITGTGVIGAGGSGGEFLVNTKSGTNLTISAPVIGSNSGTLTKAGAGTLIILSSNAYTGGTKINSGTLSGSTSSFGSGSIMVNNGATVDYTQGDTSTSFSSTINGSGSVTFGGQGAGNANGTITYTGQDTALGGTTVDSGTLALSRSGGPSISGPVAVATGAALTISPSSTNNEIATAAPSATPTTAAVTLNGGTLNANGSDGTVNTPAQIATATVTRSMGALALGTDGSTYGTLSNPSLLNMGMGTTTNPLILAFADSSMTLGEGYLDVTGYTGTTNALYIGTSASLTQTQLNHIALNGVYGTFTQSSTGELTSPEPSGLVSALLGAGGLAWLVCLRRRKAAQTVWEFSFILKNLVWHGTVSRYPSPSVGTGITNKTR